MRKLLISLVTGATLMTAGCSTLKNVGDAITPNPDRIPLIYRPTIQQGNVIDQEMVNRLKPGMLKRQVRYLLGTPTLVDVFHQERWEYLYTYKEGRQPMEQKRLTVYFEDDRLVGLDGDFRPLPVNEMQEADARETVVDVPDYQPESKGLFTRTLETVGLKEEAPE